MVTPRAVGPVCDHSRNVDPAVLVVMQTGVPGSGGYNIYFMPALGYSVSFGTPLEWLRWSVEKRK